MANTQTIPSDRFRPASHALPVDARSWQQRPAIHIVAALAVIVPMAILSVWMHLLQGRSIAANELLLWPLLGGGTLVFWILFLHLLVCGDELDGLGFRVGRPWLDLGLGAILSVALLLIIGGLGWCFFRALTATGRDNGPQSADEGGEDVQMPGPKSLSQ